MNNLEIKHNICKKELDVVYNKIEELDNIMVNAKARLESVYQYLDDIFDEQDLTQSNLFEFINELEQDCYFNLRPCEYDLLQVVDKLIQYKKELE